MSNISNNYNNSIKQQMIIVKKMHHLLCPCRKNIPYKNYLLCKILLPIILVKVQTKVHKTLRDLNIMEIQKLEVLLKNFIRRKIIHLLLREVVREG